MSRDEIDSVSTEATRRAARIAELRRDIRMLEISLEDILRIHGEEGTEVIPTAGEEADDAIEAYASNPDIIRARIARAQEELAGLEQEHRSKMN